MGKIATEGDSETIVIKRKNGVFIKCFEAAWLDYMKVDRRLEKITIRVHASHQNGKPSIVFTV
jgi:hypothetical protein